MLYDMKMWARPEEDLYSMYDESETLWSRPMLRMLRSVTSRTFVARGRLRTPRRYPLPRPYRLGLEPTNVCNIRCNFCINRLFPRDTVRTLFRRYELGPSDYERIVTEAHQAGVKVVMVCDGGEPLMAMDRMEAIMRTGSRWGMHPGFVTNGLLVHRNIDRIRSWGVEWVTVSLHSLSEEIYQSMTGSTGSGGVEDVQSGIMDLVECGINVGIHLVLTRENVGSILPVFRWAVENGVYRFDIVPVTISPAVRGMRKWPEPARISSHLARGLIASARKIVERVHPGWFESPRRTGFKTNLFSLLSTPAYLENANSARKLLPRLPRPGSSESSSGPPFCFTPWYHIEIDPMGRASPCKIFIMADYIRYAKSVLKGDLQEAFEAYMGAAEEEGTNARRHTVDEIWRSPGFVRARKRTLRMGMPSLCDNCGIPRVMGNRAHFSLMHDR